MAVIAQKSRNAMLNLAWAGFKAESRKRETASKAGEKPEVAHPKDDIVRSEPYRRLVAALACINCGRPQRSQCAHVPPEGKGIKVSDLETFPLCADGPGQKGCHSKFDQYELMPRDKAVAQGKKWAAQTRKDIAAYGLWPKNLAQPQKKTKKG